MRNKYMVLLALMFFNGTTYKDQINLDYEQVGLVHESIPEKPTPRASRFNLRHFTYKLGGLESRNRYDAVNRYGYLGRYQFSYKTLLLLREKEYLNATDQELSNFLYSPKLQEAAIVALIKCNEDYFIRGNLYEYLGKEINGIYITRQGMLAGAHLVGPYAVKQFLQSSGKIVKTDANKTKVSDYIKEFSG